MYNPPTNNIKYFLYVRKSSESEDRQMASILDQIEVMQKFAKERGIIIHDIIEEAKSAKAPGRKAFNHMLERIEAGEASGILCWKLNRLARNSKDAGQISWLLQQNTIQHIQTFTSSYCPTDNVVMMAVEFGISTQFILNLSADVKRGMAQKAKRGWYPGAHPPVGYKTNPSFKIGIDPEIVPDPETFPILSHLWELLLTGKYRIADLEQEAKSLGLKNKNGKYFSTATIYNIFSRPFYYGEFKWQDENGMKTTYRGKHIPMITRSDYIQAQQYLKANGNTSRKLKYSFPYRGFIVCGECGCSITAERKRRCTCSRCGTRFSFRRKTDCPKCGMDMAEMKNPKILDKTYYHCTKRKGYCSQSGIEKSKLENQLIKEMKKIDLPSAKVNALLSILSNDLLLERITPQELIDSLSKEQRLLERRREKLIDMRTDSEISQEVFVHKMNELTSNLTRIEETIALHGHQESTWKPVIQKQIRLAEDILAKFKNGTDEVKNDLACCIGSNHTLLDKKLNVSIPQGLLIARKAAHEY